MKYLAHILILIITLSSCSDMTSTAKERAETQEFFRTTNTIIPADDEIIVIDSAPEPKTYTPSFNRRAFFGDLHVHTEYSFDATSFGVTATPEEAYRYAQGLPIMHPSGFELQLQQPLDFYAVTDHAVFLGLIKEAADTSTEFSNYEISQAYHDINENTDGGIISMFRRHLIYRDFIADVVVSLRKGFFDDKVVNDVSKSAWLNIIKAADEAYQPGQFTTFVGYEFTSSTAIRENLHRNVIFKNSSPLPAIPFSRFNSIDPEGLWNWMDNLRLSGIESLAIPHNSNASNGNMFSWNDYAGDPIDFDYSSQRIRNEPLVEISQVKGTSDTHPLLSTKDEWANFEIYPLRTATQLPSEPPGSYVRDALQRGLVLDEQGLGNPFKFGIIASSDNHLGAPSYDEDNFFGNTGIFDDTPEKRGSVPASFLYGTILRVFDPLHAEKVEGQVYTNFDGTKYFGAAGIAGVWAEENTREAIYDAMRRKETFATSGTRLKVRFFASYEANPATVNNPYFIEKLYDTGVTMGGTLMAENAQQPTFFVWAAADPNASKIQRVQIIKGWQSNGNHMEQVYDIACSDNLVVDKDTFRCPDNGARVNLDDCSTTAGVGASELKTFWNDPNFDPQQDAFYYVRVLENPVCRWSTWDAIRSNQSPRPDFPMTIQERAWSSPIWYEAK